jgi:hypothetical protein
VRRTPGLLRMRDARLRVAAVSSVPWRSSARKRIEWTLTQHQGGRVAEEPLRVLPGCEFLVLKRGPVAPTGLRP